MNVSTQSAPQPEPTESARPRKKNSTMLILSLLLCAVAGVAVGVLFTVEQFLLSQCEDRYKPARIKMGKDGIHFEGTITHESIKALIAQIDSVKSGTPNVWLESGGGSVDAAFYFAAMAAEKKLKTSVGRNSLCASACVILFLAGTERFADESAVFGLHGAYCPGKLSALDCLLHKDYEFGMDYYKSYMKAKAPSWFAQAEETKDFANPPHKVMCYTLANSDVNLALSEQNSHIARGACTLNQRLNEIKKRDLPTKECTLGPLTILEGFVKHVILGKSSGEPRPAAD